MAGAETLLSLGLGLVRDGLIDLDRLFALLARNPAKLLGLDSGRLGIGAPADLIVIDQHTPWQVRADALAGKAANTPFDGLPVQGRAVRVIKGGAFL